MNSLLTKGPKLVVYIWLADRFSLDSTMFDLFDNNRAFRWMWALELTIVPSSPHSRSCLDLLFLHSALNPVPIGL